MVSGISSAEIGKQVSQLGKKKNVLKRAKNWLRLGAVAALAFVGTVVVGNIKNNEPPLKDVPVAAELALVSLGVGADVTKNRYKKTANLLDAKYEEYQAALQNEKANAYKEQLEKKSEAEKAEKAEKAEAAQKAAEKAKSRLNQLEKPVNSGLFCFNLDSFGVPYGTKPFEKIGADKDGMPQEGIDYCEHYKTKDGRTLEAGIKYANVPQGVDRKDYYYRYVKVTDPTTIGVVCEEGEIHVLDKNGYGLEQHRKVKLDSYKTGDYGNVYYSTSETSDKYCVIPSSDIISYFPRNEQQTRQQVMENAICQFTGNYYDNHRFDYPTKDRTFDIYTGKITRKNA